MKRKESSDSFNRIVVVSNRFGTNINALNPHRKEVRGVFGDRVVERETYPNPSDTTDMIRCLLQQGGRTLVMTLGGDGTARTAVEALADPEVATAYDATLLPLPGGNRNDLATQLHLPHLLRRPAGVIEIIKGARALGIRPISTTWDDGEKIECRLSALYSGVGAAATVADYISSPGFRNKPGYGIPPIRSLYELSTLLWAMKNVHSFLAQIDDTVDEVFDVTLANSPVMARYLHPPVDLVEQRVFYSELRSKSASHIVPYILRMMAQPWVSPPSHTMMSPGDSRTITPLVDTYLHTDGDATEVKAGTQVTFGVHSQPFRALYSRPEVLRTKRDH